MSTCVLMRVLGDWPLCVRVRTSVLEPIYEDAEVSQATLVLAGTMMTVGYRWPRGGGRVREW